MFEEDEDLAPIGGVEDLHEPHHDNMDFPIEDRLAIGRAEDNHRSGGIVPFPENARGGAVLDALTGDERRKTDRLRAEGYTLTTYEYRDRDGVPFFAVIRADHPTERKIPLPLRYCGRSADGPELFWFTAIPGTRPLQGLDDLAARPDATVLVVEGEKAADAARAKFPDLVVVTWPGGASAAVIKRVDMSALSGRRVVAWPDNDQPGRAAMRTFGAAALQAGAASFATVIVPDDFPAKWDLADDLSPGLLEAFPLQHLVDTARAMSPREARTLLENPREKAATRRLLGHTPGYSKVRLEDVEAALSFLNPDGDHIWRRAARCIYLAFGTNGLELFDNWSRSGPKYREGEPAQLWAAYAAEDHFEADPLAWLMRRAKRAAEKSDDEQPRNIKISDDALALAEIEALNRDHAVVTRGAKTVVMWETYDARFERYDVQYLKKTDFQDRHVRKIALEGEKATTYKQLGKLWFESSYRRQYDGVVFMPGQDAGPRMINTWRGFAVDPENNPDGWSRLKHHLLVNVCRENVEAYEYVLNWMAAGVQWLDRPVGTALVLVGAKGAGKSILIVLFGYLFGGHIHVTSISEDIVGRFNAHLESTLLLGVEEAFAPQNRAADGTLKDLITRRTLRVEDKFFSTWTAPNHLRIIMTSNNDQVVRADGSERRYAVLEVVNPHQADPDARRRYFGDIVEQMETGGYEAMLGELLARDVSLWNPEVIPETEALRHQKLLNLSSTPIESWYFSRLEDGVNILSGEADTSVYPWSEEKSVWVPVSSVVADYTAFAKRHGHHGDERRLKTKLARYMPVGFDSKVRTEGDVDSARRVRMYPFPKLSEARDLFTKATGYEFKEDASDESEGEEKRETKE